MARRARCAECERSNGPHFRGRCTHGGAVPPPITDRELLDAAAALYELHGHSPSKLCANCGLTPARLEAPDGALSCRRCFQAGLNHARLHVPEAFNRE